jgi:hypothetical protein
MPSTSPEADTAAWRELLRWMAAEISEQWETGRIYLNPESE